jgi:protein-L-isoaspartate(D-aspartate) O-methyltransferase
MQDSPVHIGKRNKLVNELRSKGIVDLSVLAAISSVPRHWFFPKDFEQFSYRDAAFPIGFEQTISQPYTVAFQTQLLEIQSNSKILEIGTGSGYQAAVLMKMGVELYSIEYIKDLLNLSRPILKKCGDNIKLIHGDGSQGVSKYAPYDGIIVTAGAPALPEILISQLKIGGKLVIPIGEKENEQQMMRFTRISESSVKKESFGECKFVPLIGKNGWNS